jgi:hypothetical protein
MAGEDEKAAKKTKVKHGALIVFGSGPGESPPSIKTPFA